MRMGAEKPGSEVLQNEYIEKEGSHRNKEGWEMHWKSLACLMIAHLSIEQKKN